MAKCSKCGIEKPAEEFLKNRPRCKACHRADAAAWRSANPEAALRIARESNARRWIKHREEIKAKARARYHANREYARQYYAERREQILADAHARYLRRKGFPPGQGDLPY